MRLWIIKRCIGDFSRSQNSKLTWKRRILDILYSAQHGNQHRDELSTMIHVAVRKQIKWKLVNERPGDISLARLRYLICRVYQSVNERTRNNRIRFCLKLRLALTSVLGPFAAHSLKFILQWHPGALNPCNGQTIENHSKYLNNIWNTLAYVTVMAWIVQYQEHCANKSQIT